MNTTQTVLLVLQVLLGATMIGLILLQRGKGAEMGAAFGSGASATVFGAKGSANFLSRTTAVLAAVFFMNSLALTYLGSQRPVVKSVIQQDQQPSTEPALQPGKSEVPPAPAQPPAAPATGSAPAGGAPGTSP
jgi:preprotein translocase subunit SecG